MSYIHSSRRQFILDATKLAGGLTLMASPAFGSGIFREPAKTYTVQDIINIVIKDIPNAPYPKTVDTIKAGSPDLVVTGIVTTMFPTIDIINQAKKLNANFIIAHEPSFYNHTDDRDYVKQNETLVKKLALLEQYKITLWRCHDYCHSLKPEPMRYGIVKRADWLKYYKPEERTITLPAIKLGDLAKHLKKSLGITQLRVIGDLNQSCERILLMPGASGGQSHLNAAESEKPDVLVVGELHEWETAEYIRDGKAFGGKTSLIVLGHSVSEEPGMEIFNEWLQPRVEGIKVTHIASGDPFKWL